MNSNDKHCDVCDVNLSRLDGYYLPTWKIVASEAFWRHSYERIKHFAQPREFDERRQLSMFDASVVNAARQRTPWLVCEDCSEFFIFDRREARSCAVRDAIPNDNGPVDPSACVVFAAPEWEHVFGRWPATVRQPNVVGSCDLCAKKLYAGGMASSLGAAAMKQLRVNGVIETAPLSPPHPDTDTWRICPICLARLFARRDRLDHRPQSKSAAEHGGSAMRWSRAQEPGSTPGTSIEERIAWLENVARSTDEVLKAQGNLIESQGDLVEALDEQGSARADRHDRLTAATDSLIKAQGAMIEALAEQAKVHGERIIELNNRIEKLEVLAAQISQ